jgi:hypothetical protein
MPRLSSGCAAATIVESATNKRNREVLNFDGASRNYAQLEWSMPKSYSGGAILYRVHWECSGATSGNVIWGLQAASLADGESIDEAYGTAVELTDSILGSGLRMISVWSTAMTPSGTPAGGEAMSFQFYRKADDAGDTINSINVQLVAVEFLIPVNAADDT